MIAGCRSSLPRALLCLRRIFGELFVRRAIEQVQSERGVTVSKPNLAGGEVEHQRGVIGQGVLVVIKARRRIRFFLHRDVALVIAFRLVCDEGVLEL
jgi:hypothetical protein